MKIYETIFVFPPVVSSEEKDRLVKKLEESVLKHQGKIAKKTEWGKRPLGYAVKKFREGQFLLWDIELAPDQVGQFRKAAELMPELLKVSVMAKDPRMELPPAAAPAPAQAPAASAPVPHKEEV